MKLAAWRPPSSGGHRTEGRTLGSRGRFYLTWDEYGAFPPTQEFTRVKVFRSFPPGGPGRSGLKCEPAKWRRFTFPPPSEAGIAAVPASATDLREVETQVKIKWVRSEIGYPVDPEDPPFAIYTLKGHVLSPEAGCRNGRIARLIHHPADPHPFPPEGRYGRSFLSWTESTFTEERDRVKVARSPSYPNGRFICKGDRSRRFTIPAPS